MFFRLDTPDLGKLLDTSPETGERLKKLLEERRLQELRIKDILKDYSRGDMNREEMLFAKGEARAKLDQINEEVDQVSRSHQAHALLPVGKKVRDVWMETPSLEWKRNVLDLVIDKIIIRPGGGKPVYECQVLEGKFKFDPNRVEIVWKV
ncbi:MAG: hypothetical protein ACRDR6_22720 [Pseudonocardiaceae bacterium]